MAAEDRATGCRRLLGLGLVPKGAGSDDTKVDFMTIITGYE